MTIRIDEKRKVAVIEIELINPPRPSSSGKSLLVASTNGTQVTETKEPTTGRPIKAGINLYVDKE